jgi:hypothetical protein
MRIVDQIDSSAASHREKYFADCVQEIDDRIMPSVGAKRFQSERNLLRNISLMMKWAARYFLMRLLVLYGNSHGAIELNCRLIIASVASSHRGNEGLIRLN